MSSLFTNVPLDETIEILANRAFDNDWFNSTYDLNLTITDLVDLLSVATKGQLFQYNGALYEQTDGVAMGSPLGPLLANVFMSSIEENLEREGKLPSFYQRYVDDTLTIMPNIATASNFLDTFNKAHSSVKFTMETECNGMLPFLGIQLLNRSPQIETKVYVNPRIQVSSYITKVTLTIGTNRVYSELCRVEHIVYLLLGHTSQTNVTD